MSKTMHTYARLPVSFTHGEGAWLWDAEGRRYLDALSGIAVCSLGHAHPAVTQAITEQAGKLLHTSNLYGIESQEALAQQLCELSGMSSVFFCNSGAEANEAAIKIARRYGNARGFSLPKIIGMENAFHGRTLATLSATGNPKVHEGFAPLVEGFIRVPFDDADAVASVLESNNDIAAILVEPVQGEGGVHIPSKGYLTALRELADKHEVLLMLDEIQTGIGRTGQWFAHQHAGITPDVMSLAKALGNGLPIGACVCNDKTADILQPGSHGTTFGGNPLACRAALAVLTTMQSEQLVPAATQLGAQICAGFSEALKDTAGILNIRHQGLMIGIELDRPCAELVGLALEQKHMLINVTAGNTIRLLPPMIIDAEQVELIVTSLSALIKDFIK
jgi:acetylornithine aminotransferase